METDPVVLFERAALAAASAVGRVRPDQLSSPTPCTEWDVRALVDHMFGGTSYLLSALGLSASAGQPDEATYRGAAQRCVEGLREDRSLEGRCQSPLGFEWTVAEATAGTFMDQLVHTWDLSVATGQDPRLDPELVEVCVAMFLPHMPEMGRAGGIIGPEVPVPDGSTAQDRLLGAMGRRPE